MQKLTLLILVLVVGALGFGVWWSDQQVVEFEEALFPGLQSTDVISVRVDNVARDVQVRIDRDGEGGWILVDPIEAQADETLLGDLMDVIDSDRLRLVPGDVDAAVFGFEPPEIVFQVETRGGERRSVEVGAIDVAHNTVHLRVRGNIYRAPLRLHTSLNREIADYRRPYVFKARPESIGEYHRTGESLGGAHRFGYEFHALLDNDGWRLVSPFSAGLHPGPMSLLLSNTLRIPVRSYFSGTLDTEALGFEPPERTLKMANLAGDALELQIGYGAGSPRFNCRALPGGDPFKTDADSVHRLEIPIELMLDRRVMRAARERVESIAIEREGLPTLNLARTDEGWSTSEDGVTRPADPRLFERFLANLETLLFYDMQEVGELSRDEVCGQVRFVGATEEWTLAIGGSYNDGGVECYRVQYVGDGIIGLLEFADSEFLKTRSAELRDHRLTHIDELSVKSLLLRSDDKSRQWNRDDQGRWTREGKEDEAFEILALLDPVFNLRAERFVPGRFELEDSVVVEVVYTDGKVAAYLLGRVAIDGTEEFVLVHPEEVGIVASDQRGIAKLMGTLVSRD